MKTGSKEFKSLTLNLYIGTLLAGFATAFVLGKGLKVLIDIPGLRGDSILAYLLGDVISLVFVVYFRKRLSKILPWLSVASCFFALVLSRTFEFKPDNMYLALLSFFLLCSYFAVTYLARTVRNDIAAHFKNNLPRLELVNFIGFGIALFLSNQLSGFSLADSLLISTFIFTVVIFFDYKAKRAAKAVFHEPTVENLTSTETIASFASKRYTWMLISIVVVMTVGIQMSLQRVSSFLEDSLPLLAFNIGVVAALFACSFFSFQLIDKRRILWQSHIINKFGQLGRWALPLVVFCVFSVASLAVHLTQGIGTYHIGLLVIGIAALGYELVAMTFLQELGQASGRGYVAICYNMLGIGGSIAYWALMRFNSITPCYVCITSSFVAMAVIMLLPRKRPTFVPALRKI